MLNYFFGMALQSSSGSGLFTNYVYQDEGGNGDYSPEIIRWGEAWQWQYSRKLVYDGANDVITGNEADEYLLGGGGSDTIRGGGGDDILQGSSVNSSHSFVDLLIGGTGQNAYVLGSKNGSFYKGSGYARIQGFQSWHDWLIISLGSASERAEINQTGRFESLISVSYKNMHGSSSVDTVLAYKASGDVIAVIEDIKLTGPYLTIHTLLV